MLIDDEAAVCVSPYSGPKGASKRFAILITSVIMKETCYSSCHPILPEYSQSPEETLLFCFSVSLSAFSHLVASGRDFRVTERMFTTTTAQPSEGS